MKKRIFIFAPILCIGMVSSIIATAKSSHSEVMTKKADGTYIVNTTTLGERHQGISRQHATCYLHQERENCRNQSTCQSGDSQVLQQGKTGSAQQMERHASKKGAYCPNRWCHRCHLLQQCCKGKRKEGHLVLSNT